jgi:hypothetical protein
MNCASCGYNICALPGENCRAPDTHDRHINTGVVISKWSKYTEEYPRQNYEIKYCLHCGGIVPPKRATYCSTACMVAELQQSYPLRLEAI